MNSQVNIHLPNGSCELNARDYVSCIETAIQTNPDLDIEQKDAIKGTSNALRSTSDVLCQFVEPGWAVVIRNIPIVAFPTHELNAYISKPPSRQGEFIFIDPWLGLCIEQTIISKLTDMGTFGLLLGYAFSSFESIRIGRVGEAFAQPEHRKAAREITKTATVFTLAHEFGHAICGHMKNDGALCKITIPFLSDTEVFVLKQSRRQELEADSIAIKIVLDSHKQVNDTEQLWNILVHVEGLMWLFNAVDLMQRSYEWRKVLAGAGYDHGIQLLDKALEKGTWDKELERRIEAEILQPALAKADNYLNQLYRSSTHPTSLERIDNLRAYAEKILGPCPITYNRASKVMKNIWTNSEFVEKCKMMGRDRFEEEK